jgi:protease I
VRAGLIYHCQCRNHTRELKLQEVLPGRSEGLDFDGRCCRVPGGHVSLPTPQGRRLPSSYRRAQQEKLHFVVHDFEPGYDTYMEKPGYSWDADIAFADVNPAEYTALVIPGGRAREYLRNDSACQKIVRHFFENQKPVAQLCHAGLGLAACGVLKGRRTAAYPALEPDIKAAGAEFVNAEAVVDGTMVSARAWPDHPAWMREFVRVLKQKAPIRELETAA